MSNALLLPDGSTFLLPDGTELWFYPGAGAPALFEVEKIQDVTPESVQDVVEESILGLTLLSIQGTYP